MCTHHAETFARRRAAFFDAMTAAAPSAVAVLPAAPVFIRNNDVEHEYRQDSDFFYLTGFDEPESVLVLDAQERKVDALRPPARPRPRGLGRARAPGSTARRRLGADEAFVIAELDEKLPNLLQNRRRVYYRLGGSRRFDDRLLGAIDRVRARQRLGRHRARPRSSTRARSSTRCACASRPSRSRRCARRRASRARRTSWRCAGRARACTSTRSRRCCSTPSAATGPSAPPTAASSAPGPNACVLHYRKNDRRIDAGELLLIDAGCEYGYYASDVTRTFPVGRGVFPRAAGHLRAGPRRAARGDRRHAPGGDARRDPHARRRHHHAGPRAPRACSRARWRSSSRRRLTSASSCTAPATGSAWTCTTSARTSTAASRARLEPGMVLTVEPGIYIAPDDDDGPGRVARHRRAHRGRRPRHDVGAGGADGGDPEDGGGGAPGVRGVTSRARHRRASAVGEEAEQRRRGGTPTSGVPEQPVAEELLAPWARTSDGASGAHAPGAQAVRQLDLRRTRSTRRARWSTRASRGTPRAGSAGRPWPAPSAIHM